MSFLCAPLAWQVSLPYVRERRTYASSASWSSKNCCQGNPEKTVGGDFRLLAVCLCGNKEGRRRTRERICRLPRCRNGLMIDVLACRLPRSATDDSAPMTQRLFLSLSASARFVWRSDTDKALSARDEPLRTRQSNADSGKPMFRALAGVLARGGLFEECLLASESFRYFEKFAPTGKVEARN